MVKSLRRKVAVVFNPVGGNFRQWDLESIDACFRHHGVQMLRLATEPAENSPSVLTRQAIAEGVDAVVAMGGDGTVVKVAAELKYGATPLVVVPGGTSNVFAHTFNPVLPAPVFCHMVVTGNAQPVDLLSVLVGMGDNVEPHHVIAGLTMGTAAEAIAGTARPLKRMLGNVAYAINLLRHCRRLRSQEMHFQSGEHQWSCKPGIVAVLNAINPGYAFFSPGCSPCDGLMDVVVGNTDRLLQLLSGGVCALIRRPHLSRHYQRYRLDHLDVAADKPFPISMDGERCRWTRRLSVQVLRGAVPVIASPSRPPLS